MKRILRFFLTLVVLVVAALLFIAFFPIMHRPFGHQSGPAPSYEQAVREIRAGIAATPAFVREKCRPVLLDHGRPTEYVFVFLHGLSNCPAQFTPLGQLFYERGHNVYIPRLPYHGEENRLTTDWARLTAQDMLDYGNDAADAARGLGQKVVVVGLSINGTTAAWMGQNRSDLHKVALLSPFLAPAGLPLWSISPVERILLRLPNMFFWWNPALKENNPGPPYAYPRFPTRVVGETMLLGREVLRQSAQTAPRTPSLLVVTTAIDAAANNALTTQLVDQWRAHHPVEVHQFDASLKVPHDFIDPNQPDQQTAIVYPKLIELLEK